MFRSPVKLRSGRKGEPVLLSSEDKVNVQCSLSAECTSSASSLSSPTVTMSQANNDNIDPGLMTALQSVVEKAVKTAVEAALTTFNAQILKLQDQVNSLQKKIKDMGEGLVERTDDIEQYQRRNNLRIFGVKETVGEDTDELVTQVCRSKLGIDLPVGAVSRSHRVGRRNEEATDGRASHRPIIVQFATYRAREMVFSVKKRLKGSGVTVKEDLTHRRQELYRGAVSRFGVRNVWTRDGRVLWMDNGNKGVATRLVDLPPPTPQAR